LAFKRIPFMQYARETVDAMKKWGLLLTSLDGCGRPNTMAIAAGTIGEIWGKPIFIVLVRPSRYTYGCIEATGDFTVNVPPTGLKDAVEFCGSVSGRDVDKFKEKGLTATAGRAVKSPIIKECPINYECKVVHKNDIVPENLQAQLAASSYASSDYHRVYFGEILAALADEDVKKGEF